MADKIYMDGSEKMKLAKESKIMVTGGRANMKDSLFEMQIKVDTSDCEFAGLGDTITIRSNDDVFKDKPRRSMPEIIQTADKKNPLQCAIIVSHGNGDYTVLK